MPVRVPHRVRSVVLGLVLCALAAAPAAASWEYTTWGMSESDVVAASGGAAAPLPFARQLFVPEARMTYRVEGRFSEPNLALRLAFGFDTITGGLVCVSYATETEAEAPALRDWLTRRFGRPAAAARDPANGEQSFTWREPDNIDLQIVPGRGAFVLHCARGT